jgi:hypothetical protein
MISVTPQHSLADHWKPQKILLFCRTDPAKGV